MANNCFLDMILNDVDSSSCDEDSKWKELVLVVIECLQLMLSLFVKRCYFIFVHLTLSDIMKKMTAGTQRAWGQRPTVVKMGKCYCFQIWKFKTSHKNLLLSKENFWNNLRRHWMKWGWRTYLNNLTLIETKFYVHWQITCCREI